MLRREEVFAGPFLNWCCNAAAGRWMTRLVLSRAWPSHLYGWWNRRKRSSAKIEPFVHRMQIDMKDFLLPAGVFESFAEFFTREINPLRRPIHTATGVCVSPVDGKILVYSEIGDQAFRIKSHMFRLADFVRDDAVARDFFGGSMAVIRLGLADYHHVHFPASGVPGEPRMLLGRRYIGGPYASKSWMPFYRENVRTFTAVDTEQFDRMLMAEVGGFAVATIRQVFVPGKRIATGDRKARFELGGSTVVLLFKRDTIRFDEDLLKNSTTGMETRILMGERIGATYDA